jgi:hypothetical protein
MAYLTKNEARAAAKRKTTFRGARQILTESLESYKSIEEFDIFLSHSFTDADLVLGVKTLLEDRGNKVYVDWIEDSGLDRNRVTKETAEILRARMQQSLTLYYIDTGNAQNSKWMPWELGYFDGHKPNRVFILPVLERANDRFDGREYLGLYPSISAEQIGG